MKKTLSILLSLIMIVTMLPTFAITAFADESINVLIEGTLVTSANASDVTGDGTYSYSESSHTISIKKSVDYNASTPIIVVNGPTNVVVNLYENCKYIKYNGSASAFFVSNGNININSNYDIYIEQNDVYSPIFSFGTDSDYNPTGTARIRAVGNVVIKNTGKSFCGYVSGIKAKSINVTGDDPGAPLFIPSCELIATDGDVNVVSTGSNMLFGKSANITGRNVNLKLSTTGSLLFGSESSVVATGDVAIENNGTGFIGPLKQVEGKNVTISAEGAGNPAVTSDCDITATGKFTLKSGTNYAIAGNTNIEADSVEIISNSNSLAISGNANIVANSASIVVKNGNKAIAGTASLELLNGAPVELKTGNAINNLTIVGVQDKFVDYQIDANVVVFGAHTHSGKLVDTKNSTCTTDGVKAYYECVCGKSYIDSACSNEITDLAAWKATDGKISATGHSFTNYLFNNDATCTKDGTLTAKCDNCDATDTVIAPNSVKGHELGTPVKENVVNATCTTTGSYDEVYYCPTCGEEAFRKPMTTPATGHKYTTTVSTTRATSSADGKIVKKCACGKTQTTTIKKVSTVKLGATKYTYDGKVKSPTLTVKDSAGKALVKGTDYTVTTPTGRKNVGKYTYKITFKGNYSGTKSLSFVINPKNTSVSKLTATKGGFKATIKKYTTQTTGYQIRYSTKSNMSGAKTVTIAKNTTTSKSVTGLSKGKKYYVQIRTFKTVNGTKYYSAWSGNKTVTTKK